MTKEIIEKLATKFNLTQWSVCSNSSGKYYVYMDPIGINVVFNEADNSFEFKWMIPQSIFVIECPSCSPYTNEEHFSRLYLKFWRMIRDWQANMPEKYLRMFE